MKTRMLVALFFSLVVAAPPAAAAELDGFRLDPVVSPTYERIELNLDASKIAYDGSVWIDLLVAAETAEFAFTAEEMDFDRVRMTGPDGEQVALDLDRSGDLGYVVATAAGHTLAPGDYELEVDFSKEYNTKAVGLYRMEYEGEGYLFTQFEAIDARKAFPCWDEPRYKIPFQMTIRLPEGQTAVTNTPVREETARSGVKTIVYERTKPMPSYLLAIAAGELESVPIPGLSVPGRIYTVKGQSRLAGFAAESAPPVLKALEEYFGRPYPYRKLDLIAVPEYWPGAMENPGAVTYSDKILLVDPDAAGPQQKGRLVRVSAHEFSHMWFGDLVTMAWWNDLWLNESFADWMGDKIAQQVYPRYQIELAELRAVQRIYESDAAPSSEPIRKEITSAGNMMSGVMLAYSKGKTVLGMAEQWLGEEKFREGIRSYLRRHEWGNAEAADLWNALEEVSGKEVERFLTGFLDQPGYPLVSARVEGKGTIVLRQSRYHRHGVEVPGERWVIPMKVKYFDGEEIGTKTCLLDGEETRIETGRDIEWVLPQAGAYGYYRWEVPGDMLGAIAGRPLENMDARERSVFLANAADLLGAGRISGGEYLATLRNLATATEPEIISAVVSELAGICPEMAGENLRDEFAAYIRLTLAPALERYGLSPVEGEPEDEAALRPSLFMLLGNRGRDAEVRALARRLAGSYMNDPKSVDPSLITAALVVAAIDGGEEYFEECRRRYESSDVPAEKARYLAALASCSSPELEDAALQYALSGPVRPNDLFTITRGVGRDEEGAERVYTWFTANYDEITARFPEGYKAMMPYMASGCSEDRLNRALEFFSVPEHRTDGIDANIARVKDGVMACVNLRERERASVTAYLRGLPHAGGGAAAAERMAPQRK